MDKNQTAKEGFETLGDAARRLLAGLERAKKKASRSLKTPGEILEIDRPAPSVEKEGDEGAAISASLVAQLPRGGRRGLVAAVSAANDNFAGWTSGELNHSARPALYPDANAMPKIARVVTLRGFGEW